MSSFAYKALNADKNVVQGMIEAADRQSALRNLVRDRLQPIELKEARSRAGGGSKTTSSTSSFNSLFKSTKIKSSTLVIFTRQLATMINAGVPLLRSLSGLQKNSENQALRDALDTICTDIQGGSSFADALGKHPKSFSSVYVNMVRAGESAGILDQVLLRLAIQQEKSATLKKKLKGAMAYPTVLVVIMVGAFFGLMIGVIPKIGKIVKDLGGPNAKLPFITTAMLGISDFVVHYWYIIVIVVAAVIAGFTYAMRSKKGKRFFHQLVLKIPFVKNIVQKTSTARFSRTFSALLSAGVSIIEALEITSHAIGNVIYEETLQAGIEEVKVGKQLSVVLAASPIFPSIVPQMLSVGEETGQTDTVLLKVADFYEEEVDVLVNSMSAIIEPVMIVIMGGMVGLVVASVMLPITSLASNINRG